MPVTINGSTGITAPNVNTTTSQINSVVESPYNFKNRIINGDMRIDQRLAGGTSTFTAGSSAVQYCVDRFYGFCTGANITGQQVITNGVARYRFTGAASNTGVGFGQRIEQANSFDLAGQTATLQVKLSSTSLTSVTWTAYYANTVNTFGTLGAPTKTQFATGTFSGITSTEATFSAQISVSVSAFTGIEIVLTGGALLASQTLTIGDIQLELGSTATNFEKTPAQIALDTCYQYYQKSYPYSIVAGATTGSLNAGEWQGVALSTSDFYDYGRIIFLKKMRGTPTVSLYAPSNGGTSVFYDLNTSAINGNSATRNVSQNGCNVYCSNSVNVANHAIATHWTADAEL